MANEAGADYFVSSHPVSYTHLDVYKRQDMGFMIEASHHEMAPGQHEIDFEYAEGLVTADNVMTFKMAVKAIAKRHGLHATFMPVSYTHLQFPAERGEE